MRVYVVTILFLFVLQDQSCSVLLDSNEKIKKTKTGPLHCNGLSVALKYLRYTKVTANSVKVRFAF